MAKVIRMELSNQSIGDAIRELRRYNAWIAQKEFELRKRLAELGADVAEVRFAGATYDGTNDVTVRIDTTGPVAVIYAEGQAVAFIEFGAGAKFGYGHPMAGQLGVGPGTYPDGKGHWDNSNGWYYEHGQKSYGNAPAQAMYSAVQEITENVTRIAREVFSHA